MNEALKLIEGMKKLKVITKKMQGNTERIQQYASIPSNERPYFSTEAEQTGEVKSLIQANEDLVKEYLNLKKRIELTNLKTQVTIGKNSYALADLLVLRRGLSKSMQMTFAALNDNSAEGREELVKRIKGIRNRGKNDETHSSAIQRY